MRSFLSQRLTNPVLAAVLLGLFACDAEPGTKASALPSRPDPMGTAAAGGSGSGDGAGAAASTTNTGSGEGGARDVGLAPASGGGVATGGAGASAAGTEGGVLPQVPLAA